MDSHSRNSSYFIVGLSVSSLKYKYTRFLGEDVWVISKGQWHKAKVILTEESQYPVDNVTAVPCYKIHYPGWGKQYQSKFTVLVYYMNK